MAGNETITGASCPGAYWTSSSFPSHSACPEAMTLKVPQAMTACGKPAAGVGVGVTVGDGTGVAVGRTVGVGVGTAEQGAPVAVTHRCLLAE